MAYHAAGQVLPAWEFLEESFGRLNMDWKKYVEIDPRYTARLKSIFSGRGKAMELETDGAFQGLGLHDGGF